MPTKAPGPPATTGTPTLPPELRKAFGKIRGFDPARIVWGNGSDELVDQITRIFCGPGDAVHALPPTFGMYKVAAGIAGAEFRATTLNPDFTIPVEAAESWLGR